jgi:hypothetical protein
LAWSSKTLKPIALPRKLEKNLAKLKGKIREIKYVGQNQFLYVRLEYTSEDFKTNRLKWNRFLVYDRETGKKLFDFSNKEPGAGVHEGLDERTKDLRVLGMLVCEKVRRRDAKRRNDRAELSDYEYGSEDEEDMLEEEEEEYDEEVVDSDK